MEKYSAIICLVVNLGRKLVYSLKEVLLWQNVQFVIKVLISVSK